MQGSLFFHTNHRQLPWKRLLWFSLHFSLILPHDHFGVLEVYFSLQIRLVSNLDAWSDFLDISKKAFNSLPLYRVQKLKRYSLNVKLSNEYLMNHLTPLPYYLISLLVYFLYSSPYLLLRYLSILSFIALLRSWFDHLYLFYHLLHYYRVGLTTCIYFIIYFFTTELIWPPISILLFIAFLQSGSATNFLIPLHIYLSICIPTKWLCR